jgi:hypothetical protein
MYLFKCPGYYRDIFLCNELWFFVELWWRHTLVLYYFNAAERTFLNSAYLGGLAKDFKL